MYSLNQKLKILKHVDKYGIDSAIDAFEVSESSIYSWNKKLKQSWHNHASIQNKSTRPNRLRTRAGNWDYRIKAFIQQIRLEHPGLTKEKVWKMMCNYNSELDLKYQKDKINNESPISKLPSIATVGRIIKDFKDNRHIPDWSRKLSFYANTSTFRVKRASKKKKNRPKKRDWKLPGERIQIDTVIILKKGIRRYVINAIDVYSRLSFSYAYTSLNSNNAKDFLIKMRQVFPFINQDTEIQNDNGSEFMKNFQDYLINQSITQLWNYSRSPKMNAFVERFNGSIQFEFIYRNLKELFDTRDKDLIAFNTKLMHHLLWYNTKRPHLSLDLMTPMEFILSQNQFSKMWWTSTWTCRHSRYKI